MTTHKDIEQIQTTSLHKP